MKINRDSLVVSVPVLVSQCFQNFQQEKKELENKILIKVLQPLTVDQP